MTRIDMPVTTFGFRADEAVTLSDDIPANPLGIVIGIAMIHTPPFPGEREKTWRDDGQPFAVVASYYYRQQDGWGFLSLETATKQALAEMLLKAGASVGQWYYADVHCIDAATPARGVGQGQQPEEVDRG